MLGRDIRTGMYRHRPAREYAAALAALGVVALLGWLVGATAIPAAAATSTGPSAASPHEPTIRLKRVGTSYTQVYTDGVRWAVYEPTEGMTRIMDTIKGTTTARPDPEGCAGGLIATGGGEMLYACSDPECPQAADVCLLMKAEIVCPPVAAGTTCHTVMVPTGYEAGRWVVEDVASGAQHLLNIGKGLPTFSQRDVENESRLGAIGSQWAAGGSYFVNWRTGQVVYEDHEPASADGDYEDLNSEALLVPLCSPFARRLEPVGPGLERPRYQPLSYEPPFAVESRFIGLRSYAYLRRCGSTRAQQVPEHDGVYLGAGALVGYRRHRLWRLNATRQTWLGQAYRLVGPSKWSFHIGQATPTIAIEAVATRETASEPASPHRGAPGERGKGLYEVWVGRLPWAKKRR